MVVWSVLNAPPASVTYNLFIIVILVFLDIFGFFLFIPIQVFPVDAMLQNQISW